MKTSVTVWSGASPDMDLVSGLMCLFRLYSASVKVEGDRERSLTRQATSKVTFSEVLSRVSGMSSATALESESLRLTAREHFRSHLSLLNSQGVSVRVLTPVKGHPSQY